MTKQNLLVDPFTIASVRVSLLAQQKPFGHATAFFYKRGGNLYLVSNWHVMSGRNRWTGQARDGNGRVPDQLAMMIVPTSAMIEQNFAAAELGATRLRADLNNLDGSPKWLQHPEHGQNVDVAVLPLIPQLVALIRVGHANACLEKYPFAKTVSADAYVVGFPLDLTIAGLFPVWKRATIASDVSIPIEGLPKFLIDAITSEGMSGSPVYVRSLLKAADTEIEGVVRRHYVTELIGVYSGRLKDAQARPQEDKDQMLKYFLGEVWQSHLIDEIINGQFPGTYEIR